MLAGSSTSASTLSTDTNPASSTPARPSRLRGLSYLRNYTYHHFHHSNSTPASPQDPNSHCTRSRTTSTATPSSQFPAHHQEPGAGLGAVPDLRSNSLSQAQERSTAGWLPSVSGSTDLSTPTSQLQSLSTITSTQPSRTLTEPGITMTRNRMIAVNGSRATSTSTHTVAGSSASMLPTMLDDHTFHDRTSTMNNAHGPLPSIQLIPASEPHRSRPSLDFARTTRTLPSQSAVIRVGRYSERDSASDPCPNLPSDSPIGFKSKVVSRRHCEFSFQNAQWYIKDVKSSSGTFLNHIRLSQPGHESRLYPVNDGDIVQLGIDFKGGEENIFRCVKIRVETNRGWQKGLNKFKYGSASCNPLLTKLTAL